MGAQGLRDTIDLNCWTGRGQVVNGFGAADPNAKGMLPVSEGWRAGGWPKGMVLPNVPLVPLDQILFWQGSHIDFVKMDADGPEVNWLARIDELMSSGKLEV